MLGTASRAALGIAQLLAILALTLFAPAWTLAYREAWIYLGVFGTAIVAITAYLLKNDPALLARRIEAGAKAEKRLQQRRIQVVASFAFLSIFFIASLDHRYGWSHLPLWLEIAGDVLVALGLFVVFLTFRENSFASGTVDVWKDQRVVATGVYATVRHPMYAGALLMLGGTPLALGSLWPFAAVGLMAIAIVWRLLDEERFLETTLPGYREYRTKVRYRLVPGVW